MKKLNAPYRKALLDAVGRVIDSGQYIGGAEVEEFESELAKMLNVPYVIGVGNGTDALRLILRSYIALGKLSSGQEVILPANTYIATVLAVVDAGLKPVFADADSTTMNLDISHIDKHITPLTGAIMPVHLYGRVCWSGCLARLANSHGLLVVEDNAQAIGAVSSVPGLFGSSHAGALGHAAGLSFYPTKNLGALGDAGAVATHDQALADTLRSMRNYGKDSCGRNIYAGCNSRLDPIQAAMLRTKLPYLGRENEYRRNQAKLYNKLISNPLIIKPKMPASEEEHVWHQYVIRVPEHRDALIRHLADLGIPTDIHYPIPPYRQPLFKDHPLPFAPVADSLANEVVSLPLHGADALAISRAINSFTL